MNLYEYIHEYDAYDALALTIESVEDVVAYANYQERSQDIDMLILFEDADPKQAKMTQNKNIFERIGAKIRQLITKFTEFCKWIADKIKSLMPGSKSDAEKAAQVLKDNPSLRDQIILSYKEGDMTLKDIAGLERDVEAVMRLYESGKLDEETTTGRIRKAIDKFNSTGEVILKTAGTAAGLLTITTLFTKKIVEMREANKKFGGIIEGFKNNLDKIRMNNPNASKVGSVLSALSSAMGLASSEVTAKVGVMTKIGGALRKFAGKGEREKTEAEKLRGQIKDRMDKAKDDSAATSVLKSLDSFVKQHGRLPGPASSITDAERMMTATKMTARDLDTDYRDGQKNGGGKK